MTAEIDGTPRVGETVNLEMTVNNPTDKVLRFEEVDIYDTLLGGYTVVGIDPAPVGQRVMMDFSSFKFSRDLAPDENFRITMKLQAKKAGWWDGDVDFTNVKNQFTTVTLSAFVKPRDEVPVDGSTPTPLEAPYESADPKFILAVEAPQQVVEGQKIDLKIRVTNPTDHTLKLDGIDIPESLSDGFELKGTTPSSITQEEGVGGRISWVSRTLLPGESFQMIEHLEASDPGIWSGDIHFSYGLRSVSTWVVIRVDPSAGKSLPAPEAEEAD